jgi:hypothetical protein
VNQSRGNRGGADQSAPASSSQSNIGLRCDEASPLGSPRGIVPWALKLLILNRLRPYV